MNPSFTVAGVRLTPYALFLIAGVGALLGLYAVVTHKRHPACAAENAFAVEMLILSTAAALPAALLLDALFHLAGSGEWRAGGATFYGGLLGGAALFFPLLSLKRNRLVSRYARLCDAAPCVAAGHALGRIGCFFGGCCYGKPTDIPLGVVFPAGSLPALRYGVGTAVHPTQLYEAAFLLLLALFLFFPGRKHAFPLYLILYGAGRFLLEFLRGDDRGAVPFLPLSPAQCVSLLLAALGGGMLLWAVLHRRVVRARGV